MINEENNEELIEENKKLKKENNDLKNEIIALKDKVNEQIIVIEDNKLKYVQENRIISEKYEKEIKNLKEKIEVNNEEKGTIEKNYKIKMNDIEKENQLLLMSNNNLKNDISELKNKISITNEENESQIKILNESKKDIIMKSK